MKVVINSQSVFNKLQKYYKKFKTIGLALRLFIEYILRTCIDVHSLEMVLKVPFYIYLCQICGYEPQLPVAMTTNTNRKKRALLLKISRSSHKYGAA